MALSVTDNLVRSLRMIWAFLLRVTVGSDEQNQQFISIVEAFYH
jgi:histidinol-phosphate/aromatic aminotransferase/cobyric acid decarboxylase-like protein